MTPAPAPSAARSVARRSSRRAPTIARSRPNGSCLSPFRTNKPWACCAAGWGKASGGRGTFPSRRSSSRLRRCTCPTGCSTRRRTPIGPPTPAARRRARSLPGIRSPASGGGSAGGCSSARAARSRRAKQQPWRPLTSITPKPPTRSISTTRSPSSSAWSGSWLGRWRSRASNCSRRGPASNSCLTRRGTCGSMCWWKG